MAAGAGERGNVVFNPRMVHENHAVGRGCVKQSARQWRGVIRNGRRRHGENQALLRNGKKTKFILTKGKQYEWNPPTHPRPRGWTNRTVGLTLGANRNAMPPPAPSPVTEFRSITESRTAFAARLQEPKE